LAATSDPYPNRPIRLVISYSAGGPVDIVGRLAGLKLAEALGQQVVADNRAGANGNIATEIVASSTPDGYTLLVGSNGSIAINPGLYPSLKADPLRDLAPITLLASSPLILVTHPTVNPNSVNELIQLAKSKPGSINFASAGSGSSAHLAAELFKVLAAVDLVHIPYKGAAPALTDLVAGQVQRIRDPALCKKRKTQGTWRDRRQTCFRLARRAGHRRICRRIRGHHLVWPLCGGENQSGDHHSPLSHSRRGTRQHRNASATRRPGCRGNRHGAGPVRAHDQNGNCQMVQGHQGVRRAP
jgi:hypothetical protein